MSVFRVMSYNLLYLNRRHGGTIASIAREDADIVSLQEVIPSAAEAISRGLAHRYPHRAFHPVDHLAGSGLLSRFPIVEEEVFRLSPRGAYCQHLVLSLPEGPLHFYNIHLLAPRLRLFTPRYDSQRRDDEAAALAERLSDHPVPLVVAGDFNMTPASEPYRRLSKLLVDSFREDGASPRSTFPHPPRIGFLRVPFWPVPFPVVRIDYIFHSPDIVARSTHRGDGAGSDHCPVVAALAFRRP